MAAFDSLTDEQKATILNYVDTLLRPVMGELARALSHMDAVNSDYIAQASAALALLSPGSEEIPDQSGLAGTAVLDKDLIVTLTSYVQNLLTSYNTAAHRQNYVLAAGASNTIG